MINVCELNFEPVEIQEGQRQERSWDFRHDSEFSPEFVQMLEPIVDLNILVLFDTPNDVDNTEVSPFIKINILSILILWEHHSDVSLFMEEYFMNFISFEKEVLILLRNPWLQKWADPGDKWTRLVLEQVNFEVCLLVNMCG